MAGGKLTPRQKMINMMYLVLTALLALNVSQEVLNAFHLVNEGLQTSNGSLHDKNNATYHALDDLKGLYPQKAEDPWNKAQRARTMAKTLDDSLASYKKQIIALAGGIDTAGEGDIVQRDNIDIASKMFVEEGAGIKRGKALQKLILDTRDSLLSLVDATDRATFKVSLNAAEPNIKKGESKGENWQFFTFNHVPATAAVTILTKFQNDAISSEGSVIEYLASKIGKTDMKFSDAAAKVVAPSSYVLDGQQYKADIFLAAYNKGTNPEIFLGPVGQFRKNADGTFDPVPSMNPLPPGFSNTPMKAEDGMGKYEMGASGVGEKTYGGIIRAKDPATGGYKFYPFEQKYQTAPKAVVVSPTKMNTFYMGVDNPVEISVPGVGQNDVQAAIEGGGGQLTKDPANPSNYIVKVTQQGKCKINVSAKIDGRMQEMGTKEFRVKRIPNPIPKTSTGAVGGNISLGTLSATRDIIAVLQDFDFDAHFTVTGFTFLLSSRGIATKIESNSSTFSGQMKAALQTAKSKDIVIIDDIKAIGPDRQPRKIGQLAFTIQ